MTSQLVLCCFNLSIFHYGNKFHNLIKENDIKINVALLSYTEGILYSLHWCLSLALPWVLMNKWTTFIRCVIRHCISCVVHLTCDLKKHTTTQNNGTFRSVLQLLHSWLGPHHTLVWIRHTYRHFIAMLAQIEFIIWTKNLKFNNQI